MQGGKYAAKQIKSRDRRTGNPTTRVPFKYFDKGSMATISRFSAVSKGGQARNQRIHRPGWRGWPSTCCIWSVSAHV